MTHKTQPTTQFISELPPIFAHVVTTGNSLIHVHSDSPIVTSLRRKEYQSTAKTSHFTVLPIFAGKATIGAISITDYDSEQFKSSLNYSTFLFCLDILKGLLVEHLLTSPKTETLYRISKLNQSLETLEPELNLESLIQHYGQILSQTFGWRVIAATLPTADYLLKVIEIFNFDETIKNQILKGKLYAHEDNRQGPLALAVHEKKPVIIPNTKWLEGVVHPNTIKFFNQHRTTSAAFLPVFESSRHEQTVGVYWIEGVPQTQISYSDRELFYHIMNSLSEKVQLLQSQQTLQEQTQISKNSLSQFLPQHLVNDFLAGREVQEIDQGFLMMFDLKGSTRLAHAIGNSAFHTQMESFKKAMVQTLQDHQWTLQQFVWDGFEFTRSTLLAPHSSNSTMIDLHQLVQIIEPVFISWKKNLYLISEAQEAHTEIASLSYRLCFTYGDISRGIVMEGVTQKWTFTGNAIAMVSKVEQAAKYLSGKVFCDSSIISRCHHTWSQQHITQQGLLVHVLDLSENSLSVPDESIEQQRLKSAA
jgi:class 3 adenylate cyclase